MIYELVEYAKDCLTDNNRPCGQCAICQFEFKVGMIFNPIPLSTFPFHSPHTVLKPYNVVTDFQYLLEFDALLVPMHVTCFALTR